MHLQEKEPHLPRICFLGTWDCTRPRQGNSNSRIDNAKGCIRGEKLAWHDQFLLSFHQELCYIDWTTTRAHKERHTFRMDQEPRESIGKTTSCPYQRARKRILRFYQDNGSLYWCKSCWCCRCSHSKGTWWWQKKGNCLCQPSYVIARVELLTIGERSPCHSLGLWFWLWTLSFIFIRRKIHRIYRSPTAG